MVSKKKLLLKSITYRFFIVAYELCLAILLDKLGIMKVWEFIVINNALKIIGYFLYDVLWLKPLGIKTGKQEVGKE